MKSQQQGNLSPEHLLYADLMDEARHRLDALQQCIDNRQFWVPRLLQEFCYLQLRMLCETIALGCIVAHGDIKNKKALKSWRMHDALASLEAINDDFYPTGVILDVRGTGLHLLERSDPQLSKEELLSLWARSGNYLHRGSGKKVLNDHGKPLNVNLDPIIHYGLKIKFLLLEHRISSADRKSHLIVRLSDHNYGGRTVVALAQSP